MVKVIATLKTEVITIGFRHGFCDRTLPDEVLLPVYAIIAKAVAIQPTERPAGTPKKYFLLSKRDAPFKSLFKRAIARQ